MNEIVQFQQPRLPYSPVIEERFDIDKSGWKALVEAIYPNAKSVDSVVMALSYCRARNLDPFKRPVHIVPMWDSKSGGYIETVWPGISELRTTAFRTGNYAGCDEAEFGPEKAETFSGRVKVKGNWTEKAVEVTFPEWCRMTVYRILGGQRCKFVGPKVYWIEAYATIGASDIPNDMWQNRATGQIEKCAEAAALRKAFPEEIGNELTADEMMGRRVDMPHDEAGSVSSTPPSPPSPPRISPPVPEPQEAEVIADADLGAADLGDFLEEMEALMQAAQSADDVHQAWSDLDPFAVFEGNDDATDTARKVYARHLKAFGEMLPEDVGGAG